MPIVTVSRGTMSGGTALAECAAKALGAPCLAREVLVSAATALGVSEQFLRERMERAPGLWERFGVERRTYVLAVQAALAEHVKNGDAVYHGLAGHLLLRDIPQVLRLRLIAPLETRVRALMEQRGMTRDDAERFIAQVDQHRARWTRLMYDADIEDPRLYDLVINLDKASIESGCALVVTMARRPEFAIDDAARAGIADFGLACKVRLALAIQPATRGLELEVTARSGVVTLAGKVPKPDMLTHASDRWIGELRNVVEEVTGVKKVVLDVNLVSAYH
ncbi:MAG TPA: cytidylate kinase family protein [Polyangiaceae bacterium]